MDFDYVIVGGGSAGCTLAGRLSSDPATRVCLIEAGPDDDHVLCRVPFGGAVFLPGRWRNWAFQTVPQAGLGGTLHGSDGPLNVADLVSPNPLNDIFLEACDQLQLPRNRDFNGVSQEGVGLYQVTQKVGER